FGCLGPDIVRFSTLVLNVGDMQASAFPDLCKQHLICPETNHPIPPRSNPHRESSALIPPMRVPTGSKLSYRLVAAHAKSTIRRGLAVWGM
ncbi:hypothetical protein, partial [Paenibacillus chibensis]|uniref:hypothetical protein n=1 Tax=Paenibacillus chibensis TaxID=59846 RepID=UPI002DB6258A